MSKTTRVISVQSRFPTLSGKLLSYLPTLNKGEGGYVRESETISFDRVN